LEREDVIALGRSIDCVLDQVDEVATMLVLYRVEHPTPYLLEATALLARAVDGLSQPMEVIKWNRLYDLMERAVDRCADVATVLRGVVLTNA
jgi:uncharacterized protein Yka (UPF0111/DUF47 family)